MKKLFIDRLITLMSGNKLDAILVCPSEELKFLTGFSPMMCERFQGLFIKNSGEVFYVCNKLYTSEIVKHFGDMKVHDWFDGEVVTDAVFSMMEKEGLVGKTIGVNSTAPAFSILDIALKANIKFVNAKPLFEEMRIIKTPEELNNMRMAASILDKSFSEIIKHIKSGMKEAQIKDLLFSMVLKNGGSDPGGIVASGPNTSYGHYMGGDRVVEPQDVIILDFTCSYNNLCSDMTRTVFVGGISDEFRKIYDICRQSTEAGEDAAVEGAPIPDVDKAARDVISNAGYSDYFIYRVGHGIGYMIHEAPDVKASNNRKLEKGMCFTVEPGINIPGKVGMRIEDVVAITENGTEILNKSTHELIIL